MDLKNTLIFVFIITKSISISLPQLPQLPKIPKIPSLLSLIPLPQLPQLPTLSLSLLDRQFDYEKQSSWGGQCNKGQYQSPINILVDQVIQQSKNTIHFRFRDADFKINPSVDRDLRSKYDHSTIHIILPSLYNVRYRSNSYTLHVPSEHKINGIQGQLEIQIFYQVERKTKKYTSHPHAILSILFKQIPDQSKQTTAFSDLDLTQSGFVNIGHNIGRLIQNLQLYNYEGSFSQPDCEENVDRYVVSKIFSIKTSQIQKIRKKIYKGRPNNRIIQRTRNRKVKKIINKGFQNRIKNPIVVSPLEYHPYQAGMYKIPGVMGF